MNYSNSPHTKILIMDLNDAPNSNTQPKVHTTVFPPTKSPDGKSIQIPTIKRQGMVLGHKCRTWRLMILQITIQPAPLPSPFTNSECTSIMGFCSDLGSGQRDEATFITRCPQSNDPSLSRWHFMAFCFNKFIKYHEKNLLTNQN